MLTVHRLFPNSLLLVSTRDNVRPPTMTMLGLFHEAQSLVPPSAGFELPDTSAISVKDFWAFRVVVDAKSERGFGLDLDF